MNHAQYKKSLLRRLEGTTLWLTAVSFGDMDMIAKQTRRVRNMHYKVNGEYIDPKSGINKNIPPIILNFCVGFILHSLILF
jgi:uncharacterized protein (DUF2236 family)